MNDEMVQWVKRWCDSNGFELLRVMRATENEAEAEIVLPTQGPTVFAFEVDGDVVGVTTK